jgi:hypothetical protein
MLPTVSAAAFSIARVATVLALLWGAGACGSGEDRLPRPEPQRLTPAERTAAESGHEAIRSYCRRVGLHLARGGAAPGAAVQRRAIRGARAVAGLARRKPHAPYAQGQTVRQLAGDTAEDLEGTNCSGRLVRELERGL